MRDRTRCPRIEDLETLLREVEDVGSSDTHCVIVDDIAKSHRLVPVRERDWGLQAFQLTGRPEDSDEVIMYSVAPSVSPLRPIGGRGSPMRWCACYTIAWVSFGRYGASSTRMTAGDSAMREKGWESFTLMLVLILETYGFPVAWHKVKAGTRIEWVGYQL